MIQQGDRIAVGVSGGKDSLCLLVALKRLQNFYPEAFHLEAVTLDIGPDRLDTGAVEELCNKMGITLTIEKTHIGKLVFDVRKEKNPCSMCANMRRGALNNAAKRLGCNKVATGHNRDDVIETCILSMFYEGRFNTFLPVTYLERKDLYLIRPLIYSEEKNIKGFITAEKIKTVKNPCPMEGKSKRQFVKGLLSSLARDIPHIKNNIFGAVKRSAIDGWRQQ